MVNTNFKSIFELIKAFPDEQSCINHLEELRWNGNIISPFDATSKVYKCKGNKYRCKNTGKYFNVRTGTLFDNTKVPLRKWFMAIFIVTSHKKGISSLQLSRDIDVTQKTAWFMLQRIRNCFKIKSNIKFDNDVEVDETYVGGKNSNRTKSKRKELHKHGKQTGVKDKTPVLGMLQREKGFMGKVIRKAYHMEILPILYNKIKFSATVITDGFGAYHSLSELYKQHVIINHEKDEYVNGEYHTNTIEGFWSLLKRGIIGIYHFTSDKHLQKYVDEFAFRYNTRTSTTATRFNLMLLECENRITYSQLIG